MVTEIPKHTWRSSRLLQELHSWLQLRREHLHNNRCKFNRYWSCIECRKHMGRSTTSSFWFIQIYPSQEKLLCLWTRNTHNCSGIKKIVLPSVWSILYSLYGLLHAWILQGPEGSFILPNLLDWLSNIIWLWYQIYQRL